MVIATSMYVGPAYANDNASDFRTINFPPKASNK